MLKKDSISLKPVHRESALQCELFTFTKKFWIIRMLTSTPATITVFLKNDNALGLWCFWWSTLWSAEYVSFFFVYIYISRCLTKAKPETSPCISVCQDISYVFVRVSSREKNLWICKIQGEDVVVFRKISKVYAGGVCIATVCNIDMQREERERYKTKTALEDKPPFRIWLMH